MPLGAAKVLPQHPFLPFLPPPSKYPWKFMAVPLLQLFSRGLALLCFTSTSYTWAEPVNRTIDDEYGDSSGGGSVQYTPSGSWNQGATCSACWAKPDESLAYKGTWHDSTTGTAGVQATLNITFHGQFLVTCSKVVTDDDTCRCIFQGQTYMYTSSSTTTSNRATLPSRTLALR